MASTTTNQDRLIAKLEELRARYEAITEEMNRPEVAGNATRIVALTKEHGKLRRMLEPYHAYRQALAEAADNQALADDPAAEPELREMAEEEIRDARRRAGELFESMKRALVTGEDAAIQSVIVEIRAGTAARRRPVRRRSVRYVSALRRAHRFKVEVLDASPANAAATASWSSTSRRGVTSSWATRAAAIASSASPRPRPRAESTPPPPPSPSPRTGRGGRADRLGKGCARARQPRGRPRRSECQ